VGLGPVRLLFASLWCVKTMDQTSLWPMLRLMKGNGAGKA